MFLRYSRLHSFLLLGALVAAPLSFAANADLARLEKQAHGITILRDTWGIAHIYGKTDADAVFGMIYTQCEDDFNRVETNYLTSLGRTAEAEGEAKIWQDLRQRLFIDPADLQKKYKESPAWLQKLMNAWADGANYYLAKHPAVKPKVITHFEPWMALSFTEGSIGGDIERVNLAQLEAFYGGHTIAKADLRDDYALPYDERPQEPTGSNGAAIAPANTVNHHALLLINPHTSFFFRSELQMVSQEGLNAYGAVTWGQFFIYQGFNDKAGWMHTTSGIDSWDDYLETVTAKDGHYTYRYGNEQKPVAESEVTIRYKTANGFAEKKFRTYRTQHGPITRQIDGKWVAYRIMQEPIKALEQSYLRTKARNYKTYLETMELKANSSNNTIFADADGDIAYFHGNYLPRRDTSFDWTKPVDGSNPATEYKGLHDVKDLPNLFNPASGWLYNSNNWPWSAAGPSSLKREDYPKYVESGGESARGLHAVKVFQNKKDFTLDSFLAAAYDSYLTWFDKPLPALLKAYEAAPANDPMKAKLAEPIAMMKAWDQRWGVDSIPTSLGQFWFDEVRSAVAADARNSGLSVEDYIASKAPGALLLKTFAAGCDKLQADFGSWKTPWGNINRFQRLTGDIVQPFNDAGPSIPVGFTSAQLGSLASFGARSYPGTKKWYGTSGNSFVAVVEFGDKVRARAVTAGGESGDVKNKHFNDQAERYATGNLRDVFFYREDVEKHLERRYRPGDLK